MATLVSGINVTNGTVITPSILNAAPTLTAGTVLPSDLNSSTNALLVPTGVVLPFAYSFTQSGAPAGWLICDGSLYSTTTYANLYALIGTLYGSGTGTFAVPDLRGYFIRGTGTNADGTASGTFGSKQADQLQGHIHNLTYSAYVISGGGSVGSGAQAAGGSNSTGDPLTDGTNGTPRYGSETRPSNIAMLYCIKS